MSDDEIRSDNWVNMKFAKPVPGGYFISDEDYNKTRLRDDMNDPGELLECLERDNGGIFQELRDLKDKEGNPLSSDSKITLTIDESDSMITLIITDNFDEDQEESDSEEEQEELPMPELDEGDCDLLEPDEFFRNVMYGPENKPDWLKVYPYDFEREKLLDRLNYQLQFVDNGYIEEFIMEQVGRGIYSQYDQRPLEDWKQLCLCVYKKPIDSWRDAQIRKIKGCNTFEHCNY